MKTKIDFLIDEANKIIEELAEENDNLCEIAKIRVEQLLRKAELLGFSEAYELLQGKLIQNFKNNVIEK